MQRQERAFDDPAPRTQRAQPTPPTPRAQRARGRVVLGFGVQGVRRLRQEGCARCLMPSPLGGAPLAVVVNTAGGLTGGDRFAVELSLGARARLVLTTQAAERLYRSAGGRAEIRNRVELGRGARLDWLPQETIVFDGAGLDRRLEVDMAQDARFLGLEMLVLGRRAMGEALSRARLADHWRIRRAGRLLHGEALRLEGDIAALGQHPALLDGARALATMVLVAPGAEAMLERARALLPGGGAGAAGLRGAASARDGRLLVRWLAADLMELKAALARWLEGFPGAAVPRLWQV